MFEMKNHIKPLTEDQKSSVRRYFESGELGDLTESRVWLFYGRMKSLGESIPAAESVLDKKRHQKMEDYKLSKEAEISRGLHDYENEHQEASEYEVMKINERENWRTLVIGILDYDVKQISHSHVIEIEEASNPSYFSECMMRYAPRQALSTDKPF